MGEKLLKIKAPAKVNFYLEVTGKRPDGYHGLRMLMAPVSVYDELTLEKLEEPGKIEVFSEGSAFVASGEANICHRAAAFYFQETGASGGVRVRVKKKIPVGAGMGGGSSDAASVMMGLEKLYGKTLSPEGIIRSAFGVGADVPFFFARGWAWVEGIGEIVRPVRDVETLWLTIIHPGVFLSTASVFSRHTKVLTSSPLLPNIAQLDFRGVACGLRNDLERPALELSPEIGEALDSLRKAGGAAAAMTGSGSAVFALFPSFEEAERARKTVSEKAPAKWAILTACTLGEVSLFFAEM